MYRQGYRHYNPVIIYAFNVFVLQWFRVYDKPLTTLAFASPHPWLSDANKEHNTLQDSLHKRLRLLTRSFSSKDDAYDENNKYNGAHSKAPTTPPSSNILDWLDDFQLSNTMFDLRKKFQSEDLLNMVSTSDVIKKYGADTPPAYGFFDRLGRTISLYSGYIVAWRLVMSLLTYNNNNLIKEITDKLFSPETATAMKSVWTLFNNVSDHGIVDLFATYPARDVAASILAFSRLQHVTQGGPSHEDGSHVISDDHRTGTQRFLSQEKELIDDLSHYAVFAGVAYGWKFHLLLKQQLHLGDAEALTQRTGIDPRNIVSTNWISRTHLPAYYIVRDVERERIVLCIRGTMSAKDVLTDLCCTAEDFDVGESEDSLKTMFRRFKPARAHHGMLQSAKGVAAMTRKIIASQLAENPTYKLVIVGHSLGGGTAAVLGTLWRDTFPGLKVFAYGCPCVGPLGTDPTSNDSIVSVVGEGDPFSCLSLGHLADLSLVLSHLCENTDLRNEILFKTANKGDSNTDENNKWSIDTVRKLRETMNAEKLYPPGRIIYLGIHENDLVSIRQVDQLFFRELTLHPRMLDLSRHIPHHYEAALSKLHAKAKI